MDEYNPNMVCFSCSFGWGYLSGEKDVSAGLKNWVPVTCSGKIETTHILTAFKLGTDGVLILACPEGHCHFQDGNFQMSKRTYLLQKVLDSFGIEHERIQIVFERDPEGKKIPQIVNDMRSSLAKLGPVKKF